MKKIIFTVCSLVLLFSCVTPVIDSEHFITIDIPQGVEIRVSIVASKDVYVAGADKLMVRADGSPILLKGTDAKITFFGNIKEFNIADNHVVYGLDVTHAGNLESLVCANNELSELDLHNCLKLKRVLCYTNKIKTLNLNGLEELQTLWCHSNNLIALDFSDCKKLQQLRCYENNLRQSAMDNMLMSLPTMISGMARVRKFVSATNEMPTANAVTTAKLKGWKILDSNDKIIKGL